MEMLHEGVHKHNAESTIVLEECSQHIYLVPRSPFIDPLLRIFEREKDIVEVNINARSEGRKDLEEDTIYVAVDLADVRGVNEQNVIRFELLKLIQANVLQPLRNNPNLVLVIFLDEGH